MTLETFFENVHGKRLMFAISASVVLHLIAAAMIETSMGRKREVPPTPVEISRRPVEGTSASKDAERIMDPSNPNSPLAGVEAGVPVRRDGFPPASNQQSPTNVGQQQPNAQRQLEQKLPPFSNTGIPVPRNPRQNNEPSEPRRNDAAPPNESPIRPRPDTSPDNTRPTQPDRNTPNQGSGSTQAGDTSASNGGYTASRRSRGPNRGPFPASTVEPRIPASLMGPGVQNSVGVRVDIRANGTFTVSIQRSSGSSQVDDLVLSAMRQWKWDPAAENNIAIDSNQTFKYVFRIG
jgi:TonB family protein